MAISVRLPLLEQSIDATGKLVREEKSLDVTIDTSIFAHLKWEEQFQPTLKVDLATYSERVVALKDDKEALKANFLSVLKVLYCYIDSDRLPTFKSFIKALDLSIADKALTAILDVLNEVERTLSKN